MFHEFDLHMHTPFSDGQINLDLQIQTAIHLGLKIIGFADHINQFSGYTHPTDGSIQPGGFVRIYSAEKLRYRKGIIRYLGKKYPQIRLLNGAEIDILPNGSLSLPRGITPDFFDYVLVSKHFTIPKDIGFLWIKYPYIERWLWTHSPRMKLNAYMWEKGLYSAFQHTKIDILAHPYVGMPKSIGIMKDRRRMKRFVLMCKKYDVAIELNNLFWDKKQKKNHMTYFYPILEYGHEYEVKFSLASDFHGFDKNIPLYLNKSQEMVQLVEKYDLQLIDPHKFLPENTGKL